MNLQECGRYGLHENNLFFDIQNTRYAVPAWQRMKLDEIVDICQDDIKVGRAARSKDTPRWNLFIAGTQYSIRTDDLRKVLSGSQIAGQVWIHLPDIAVSPGQQTLLEAV